MASYGDDFVYKIFFDDNEIEQTKDSQSKDVFKELL